MTAPARSQPDAVAGLLRDAARWRLAGLLLRRPQLSRARELTALAAETADADMIETATLARATTEGLYHAWLGPGGPLSPREVSYKPIEDPGRLLAEIAAHHEAFAYRAGTEDPKDHVAVAADFTAYLALKEAYARLSVCEPDAATTREARERFVANHVRPLACGMARRMACVAEGVAVAHFAATIRLLCRLAGVSDEDIAGDDVAEAVFPLAGLDEPAFDCGRLDGSGCAHSCPAMSSEPTHPAAPSGARRPA